MTAAVQAPLTPAGCDLTDFQYMELDVRRLRDSRFAAAVDGEAFRAGILLWCAAWHQVPAASLPDDDIELANLAGYGRVVKEWKKVRTEALHGFVKCSDGRLYHPVIAEKATAAFAAKERHAYGKFVDRVRKENAKREREKKPLLGIPAFDAWKSGGCPAEMQVSAPNSGGIPAENLAPSGGIPAEGAANSGGIPAENALRGNREGEGKGTDTPLPPDGGGVGFEEFFGEYPKKAAEAKARQEWAKLSPDAGLQERILSAVRVHRTLEQWTKEGGQYVPTAANWLKDQRWLDDVGAAPGADPVLVEGSAAWLKVMGGRLGVLPCGPLESPAVWAVRVRAAVSGAGRQAVAA